MMWKSLTVGAIIMALEPIAQCGLAWRLGIIVVLALAAWVAWLGGVLVGQLKDG